MSKFWPALSFPLGFLALLTPLEAQQVIRNDTVLPLASPLPPDRMVRLYAPHGGEAVFLVGPRVGGNLALGELVTVDSGGNSRRMDWGGILPVAAAAHGTRLFLIQAEAGRLVGLLADRRTGSRVPVPISGNPISAALCEKWLAVLSLVNRQQATVSLFDAKGALLQQTGVGLHRGMATLSFVCPERLLILGTDFRVTEVTVGPPLTLGPTVTLSGPEVAASRVRNSQLGGIVGQSQFFSGYIPGRNGHHLFFLSPYRFKEGARLVQFDSQGTQVASYRLLAEEAGKPAQLLVDFGRIAADEDKIWLVAANGSQFSFRRP